MTQAALSNIERLTIGKMVNSSGAMFDRRRRILREARRMISLGGLDAFNMRDLGTRADVSTRTIYNAFGSKEMVVALAIHAYFETFVSHIRYTGDPEGFEGALARQVTSTLRDVDIPHYMKALVALYYSPTLHPDIRTVLLDMASRSWVPWLRRLQAQQQIRSGVELDDLIVDLSNLQYGKVHEWCLGELNNVEFVQKSLSGVLLLLMGAASGKARRDASHAFDHVQSDTAFRRQLLKQARERITTMEIEGRRGGAQKRQPERDSHEA
jgi:AcrR family transcriptional regulator